MHDYIGTSPLQNFGNFFTHTLILPVFFGRDTTIRWSLLSGVHNRGSKRSHTEGKCVTCRGRKQCTRKHFVFVCIFLSKLYSVTLLLTAHLFNFYMHFVVQLYITVYVHYFYSMVYYFYICMLWCQVCMNT